jgi:hypothetical protein
MAGDLDVSAAAWGTAKLLLVSGDDIDGDTGYGWGSQVASNTGWLYYQPRMAHSGVATITNAVDDFTTISAHVWVPIGTYSLYGIADADATGTINGTAYVKWDGTALVTFTNADATTGSLCGWSTDTARWVVVRITGSADGADVNVTHAVAVRFGSWAP